MSRGIFGWSYPPGAASDPSAPYNQSDQPCAVCGQFDDECICPECAKCGAQGDPSCYEAPVQNVTWAWEQRDGRRSRTGSIVEAQDRLSYLFTEEAYTKMVTPDAANEVRDNNNAEAYALSTQLNIAYRKHGMTRSEAQIESLRNAESEWQERFSVLRDGT